MFVFLNQQPSTFQEFLMQIQTVGIIGAGTMGNGIAQACATSGINVVMVDISEAAVQKG
ncbi:MAG: NAD(P)-binding domain-containing protein, partial [Comamonas sp.]|nr:NAD(P)-binding domain-containing protein [Comamonas sp.]